MLATGVMVLAAAPVRAQKVVVLPSNAGPGGEAVAKLADTALRDALAMQGLRVVGWDEAKSKLAAGQNCDDVAACTPRAMTAAAAELAAGVVVTRNAQGAAERVRVALLDTDKRRYDGEAEVEDGDVRTATTRALLEARSFQLLGPGPWLRVEGTPEGAEVLLDDRIVGRVPYRATIIPGKHKVRVREAGYTAFEQQLEIPATDDAHVAQVVVALEPAPIAVSNGGSDLRAVADGGGEKRSSMWLVGPLVLGGLGVVLAGVTTVRIATEVDSCVNPDRYSICTQRRTVNTAPAAIEYTLSAALIGASIAWIIIGTNDTQEGVSARLGPDSISLAGRF
ncbi:MAG TPA: PEGA domain-containing protein [Polyangiales bacterium]|nr:PEGA domain-containing protein [Polyangiales bacterium]